MTWPVVRDLVDDVITVTDDQIRAAMRLVWERMKCVIEPSAAVGVAVALSDEFRDRWGGGPSAAEDLRNVGVVLCGGGCCQHTRRVTFNVCVYCTGNIDLDNLSTILRG